MHEIKQIFRLFSVLYLRSFSQGFLKACQLCVTLLKNSYFFYFLSLCWFFQVGKDFCFLLPFLCLMELEINMTLLVCLVHGWWCQPIPGKYSSEGLQCTKSVTELKNCVFGKVKRKKRVGMVTKVVFNTLNKCSISFSLNTLEPGQILVYCNKFWQHETCQIF